MEGKGIIVDKKDNVIRREIIEKCHSVKGILHRAITIFIFNKKNQLLITKRSKFKKLWPLIWETSCSAHVHEDETYEQVGEKRLLQELGFFCELKSLLKFKYKSKYKNIGSENEICNLLIGKYNGEIKSNWKEVANWKWISLDNLKKDINKNPEKYAPWLKIAFKKYLEHKKEATEIKKNLIMFDNKKILKKYGTNLKPYYYKTLTLIGKNVDKCVKNLYKKEIYVKFPEKKELYKKMLDRKYGTQKLRAMASYLAFCAFKGKEVNNKTITHLITAVELENYSNYELNWLFDQKADVKSPLEIKKAGLATHGFFHDALYLVSKIHPIYTKVFLEINDRVHRGWTPELFDLNFENKKILNDFEYFWEKYKIRNVEAGGQFWGNYVTLAHIYYKYKQPKLHTKLKKIFEEFGEYVQILNDLGDFALPGTIILHEKKVSDQLSDLRHGLVTWPIWLIYNRSSKKDKDFLVSLSKKKIITKNDYIKALKLLYKTKTFDDIYKALRKRSHYLQQSIEMLDIQPKIKGLLKVLVVLLYCNKLTYYLKKNQRNLNFFV